MKKIGVLTGGGDCPGLNSAIRGIVMRAMDYNYEVTGILEGWKGLITGETFPLKLSGVEEIMSRGGTLIGTSRTNPFKKEEDVKKVMDNFQKMTLHALIAIGGEDTLGVAHRFHKKGMPVVGVPKTMDNDLSATDYTLGFDTSVTIAMDAVEKLRDTARSHRRVIVLEVMGRHAGWVALFTALGGGADWVLIPEKPVDFDAMSTHLQKVYQRKSYGIVVASEGVELPSETGAETKQEVDAFGHVILKERGVGERVAREIEKRTGIETRWAVIGHIQRGGAPTLFDRILAFRTGVKAVDLVHEEKFGEMACLVGNEICSVPLEEAVEKLKTVSDEWCELVKVTFK